MQSVGARRGNRYTEIGLLACEMSGGSTATAPPAAVRTGDLGGRRALRLPILLLVAVPARRRFRFQRAGPRHDARHVIEDGVQLSGRGSKTEKHMANEVDGTVHLALARHVIGWCLTQETRD